MKSLIAVALFLSAGIAYACTTSTFIYPDRVVVCTTCCNPGGGCTTTCI